LVPARRRFKAALPALLALALVGMAVALTDSVAADSAPAPSGFGGPTVDLPPDNGPPSYRPQNLPVALRISADRQRIVESDSALISACNFEARIDWGTVRDIPVGTDGTFQIHTDYSIPLSGKTGSLDISGHVSSDRVDGSTRLAEPSEECGIGVTWKAVPAFVGTTSQHTPAVIQLSHDRSRIARLLLVWLPHCPGGTVDRAKNAIGVDQPHVARIGRAGRFTGSTAARKLQTTADVQIERETVAGRLVGEAVAGYFYATGALGTAGRAGQCDGKPVRFVLHRGA
jgi:hypothetical protein